MRSNFIHILYRNDTHTIPICAVHCASSRRLSIRSRLLNIRGNGLPFAIFSLISLSAAQYSDLKENGKVATPCNKPTELRSVFFHYYYLPMVGRVGLEPTSPFSLGFWYRRVGLNHRRLHYQCSILPSELLRYVWRRLKGSNLRAVARLRV